MLHAIVAVPPFGRAAGSAGRPVRVRESARIAAAALALGEPRSAAATLHAIAAAARAAGELPARLDDAAAADDAAAGGDANGTAPTGEESTGDDPPRTQPAGDDARSAAACFATLAQRYLAATGDRALMIGLWPLLRKTHAPDALRIIAEAIGRAAPGPAHGRPLVGLARAETGQRPPAAAANVLRAPLAAESAAGRAAASVLMTVEDRLGFAPDAARQRLELAPRIPVEWSCITVDELTIGDAAVRFEYRRHDAGVTIVVEQLAGAVPLRLVLNAALPLSGAAVCRVDGEAADLAVRMEGGRLLVPVQLSLEQQRRVDVS